MLSLRLNLGHNQSMAGIKVKRRTQLTRFSNGNLPALEFPLEQEFFELKMIDYQILNEHFMPYCDKCEKAFESYPDFIGHAHKKSDGVK